MRYCAALMLLVAARALAGEPFALQVVDDQTGRGVPLIELRTVDNRRWVTDSAGLAAIEEPELLNRDVFFYVAGHGYEFPPDGFGFRGKAIKTSPGGSGELRVRRVNVAERLYRATGAGIYRDSVRLGRDVPIRQPLLNAQVAGSDSVNSIIFNGQIYWFWGDTNRPAYPLGLFHVPGAVSKLPGEGGLDPDRGVDLEYFTRDDGFVAAMAEMPGDGPTWIDGVCVIREQGKPERMFARYMKVRKMLEVYERGLLEFNTEAKRFDKVKAFDFAAPLYPQGHSLAQTIDGTEYVYFGNPYPLVRVRATAEALAEPRQYEAFTPLAAGSTLEKPSVERDSAGRVVYGWKANTPPITAADQGKWEGSRLLRKGEGILALRDVDTGKDVRAHAGTVAYNAFRRRYVMITEQYGGTSLLGEVWYAEADTPVGPWVYARKVVTHDKYSFYNPRHHPMFDQDGGRKIYFEGTYSTFFTNEQPTPLYDYNQIMYRLDLADERLVLPVAVYEKTTDGRQAFSTGALAAGAPAAFFACDRPKAGLVGFGPSEKDAGAIVRAASGEAQWFGWPADAKNSPAACVPLFEWKNPAGTRYYAVQGQGGPSGFTRSEQPIALVWRNPMAVALSPR